MAVTSRTKKGSASKIGAPAQHGQASRKGKKAWRKNVDLEDVEDKLDGLRDEERIYGAKLQEQKDEELFVVDKVGDDKIRRHLPKFSTRALTAHKILTQRSAVPAVPARPSSSTKKSAVTSAERARLLKLARRDRRGPLNSLVDHAQVGEGSALVEVSNAARQSGRYDVWGEDAGVPPPSVKPPTTPHPHPRTQIDAPAVSRPHAGTSYNPTADAHTELLRAAHEAELRRVREKEALEAVKERILRARREVEGEGGEGGFEGMIVDRGEGGVDDDGEVGEEEEVVPKKVPGRKTKQQRRKAERLRAEKRALAERALRKRLLASIDTAKHLSKTLTKTSLTRASSRAERLAHAKERLSSGALAGLKVGKHRVPEAQVDVQLGEELSESLRGLRPEGNLFRERFVSMQQRALVEPRVPVVPTKRAKMKVYEKHDHKRFE